MIKIIFVLGLAFLAACSSVQKPAISHAELQKIYLQAVDDMKVVQPNEISRDLTAIVPSNDELVWNKDKSRVLVVSWTSENIYDQHVDCSMKLPKEVWVTAAPELKKFCHEQNITREQIPLRIEQLLGLPPGDGKTKFVEIWVSPNDLFRPSPDPEISDHEAELDFPVSSRFVSVSNTHKKWFFDRINESYGKNGYPWTRLGYTYDWGNPESDIGLSEFVIRPGAMVKIHSITKSENYCTKQYF